jgi:ABC-type sugar transport system ATPase subunit
MLLGIRPEHLRVRPLDDDAPAFPAIASRIRRVEFQGDSALITVELAGTTAVARVAAVKDHQEGKTVAVSPDLAQAVWFPSDHV